MKSGLAKVILMASSISSAAVIGDSYDVCDNIINPLRYRGIPVAEGFYPQPFDLRKQYRFNKEGALEVYFGDVEMYPVKEGLRVNERRFGELLKEKAKVWVKEGGKRLDQLVYVLGRFSHNIFAGNEDGK